MSEQIVEILQGRDQDRGGQTSFAFRTVEGAMLCGAFLQPAGAQITDLVSVTEVRGPSGASDA